MDGEGAGKPWDLKKIQIIFSGNFNLEGAAAQKKEGKFGFFSKFFSGLIVVEKVSKNMKKTKVFNFEKPAG